MPRRSVTERRAGTNWRIERKHKLDSEFEDEDIEMNVMLTPVAALKANEKGEWHDFFDVSGGIWRWLTAAIMV